MRISIANQKGGVGKTTTCINLASLVASRTGPCLILDLDPQGNCSSGLGVDKAQLTLSSYHLMAGQAEPDACIVSTGVKNLDIIPSTTDLAAIEIELASEENRALRLKEVLEKLRKPYKYIFVDCPPSLGLLTINALVASDALLIPVQTEFYALEGLSQLMETYQSVKASYNSELRINGLLLTMSDVRTQLAKQVESELRRYYDTLVYQTVIPRNVRLSEAPSYAKPIHLYDRLSKGARAYGKLCKEFLKRAKEA